MVNIPGQNVENWGYVVAQFLRRRFSTAILIFMTLLGSFALTGCEITPDEPVLHGVVEAAPATLGGEAGSGMAPNRPD